MLSYSRLSITQRLSLAHTAIANALADPEMIALLTPYAYDETRLQEGLALYQEAAALFHASLTEQGEKLGATADLYDRWSESRELLADQMARARIALRGKTAALLTLRLNQRRARRQAEWIVQARHFYAGALNDQEIMDALATMSITRQDLLDGLEAVNAFEQARQRQAKESGDTQGAFQARNEAQAALDRWVRDFRDIARLALRNRPQLIERLGFRARNS